jgi:proteic killer suppression protein
MISTFRSDATRSVFEGLQARQYPPNIQNVARRKLVMLNQARELRDLLSPPGNRLEALNGNRLGQYSIRIKDQWRVCFVWREVVEADELRGARTEGNAFDVEIVDYH